MSPQASPKRKWLRSGFAVLVGLGLTGWLVFQARRVDWENPEQMLHRARTAWSTGRLGQAEEALAALAQRRPATVAERLLRAQIARQRGRIDVALAALEGVADSDRDAALIWQTRGLLEFDRDRFRPAEEALLHAVRLDPEQADARRGLIDLYTMESRHGDLRNQFSALARSGVLSFDDLYLWCLGRRQDVGPAELAAKLERMLGNDSENRAIRLALAANYRRLGRLAEAEAALGPLPATDSEALAERARLAIDRGAVDEAEKLLACGPSDHPALAQLRGRLALSRGESAAVDYYRRALAADPDDRDTLFGLGQSLRVAGKPEAAGPYLQAAQKRDHLEWLIQNARSASQRDLPEVLAALGDACRSLGRTSEARAWYRLAISRNPLVADVQKRLFELDAESSHDASQARTGNSRPRQ
jgi:tetratricopeptide (TPR) repeat protein